jgi:23S rRNA (adenine2030-N6)-methyltransferase
MLSYQHGYHAGNFADVVKHFALTLVLNYLTEKDKPLLYLETHSGKGLYDFKDKQAQKTKEFQEGINLLWEHRQKLPTIFSTYLDIIGQLNPENTLRYYPGSPYLAMQLLRDKDRLFLCELHPREFETLSSLPTQGKRVHFSESNGLESLKALIPPPEKRGLIFIDPSFEQKQEYAEIPKHIKAAYERFSTGVYCLWYPLVDKRLTDRLTRNMKAVGAKNNLQIEFHLNLPNKIGLVGTGLWIINPPFLLAKQIQEGLSALTQCFNPGKSTFHIKEI